MTFNLRQRRREPEWMDHPGLDPALHDGALSSLSRLNRWAGSDGILWPAIRDLAASSPGRECRVLDIATGAGDVPMALSRRAKRCGLHLDITAVDLSPHAVDYARRNAADSGAKITLRQCDVLCEDLPEGEWEVVMCSLFLHHLDEAQAVRLLGRMGAASKGLVLVSDLRRSMAGLWLTHLAARVVSRSPVVRVDGPRSVRAAFTLAEAASLAGRAGWTNFQVRPLWPFRFLLMERKGGS